MTRITSQAQWGLQQRYTDTAGDGDGSGKGIALALIQHDGGAAVRQRDHALRFSQPVQYSRMLRRAHELVISGVPDPGIPDMLADSWRRSLALGINPDQHSPRRLHEVSEVHRLRRGHRLQEVIPALSDLLADDSGDGRHLLVVTDARGEILWRVGSRQVLRRADSLEFAEGADWSEAGIGTNAISEVLATGRPVQLFSGEHLVRTHHEWACTAAPITDPGTGDLLGVLDVSGPLDSLTADTLRLVRCAVRLAEAVLARPDGGAPAVAAGTAPRPGVPAAAAGPAARRPAAPRPATAPAPAPAVESLELLGDNPAAVFRNGTRAPLTLRRAEILALLDSRRRGWTAEELAYELHGDAGMPATIRTEMFRVRSILGDAVASGPYRLREGLAGCSDAGRVLGHLHEGRAAEALQAYRAPLLARSGTLAVQLLRDRLDLAVGAAVRASGDAGLISRWLSTDMGAEDAAAVQELGKLLGRGDARYLAFRAGMEA